MERTTYVNYVDVLRDIQQALFSVKSVCKICLPLFLSSVMFLVDAFLRSLCFYFDINVLFVCICQLSVFFVVFFFKELLFVFTPVHKSPNLCITIYRPAAPQLKTKMARDVTVSADIFEEKLVVGHLCHIRELKLS